MTYPRQNNQTRLKGGGGFSDPFAPFVYFLVPFNINGDDVLGQTGTLLGSPTPTFGAPAQFGNAGQFGANTGRISYPGTGSAGLWTGDITVEWWMRTTSFLVNRGIFATNILSNGTIVSLLINTSGVLSYNFRGASVSVPGAMTVNTWYHHAIVMAAGTAVNSAKVYRDGVQILQSTPASAASPNASAFRIGNDANDSQGMGGAIDDFRITKALRYTANFTPPGELTYP